MAAKASCQVTIADITDAYSVVLTSETYTFMGNTSGAPVGSTCTTQAIAYQGNTQCSKVTIGTISCPTGISSSITNNGTASPTITFKTTAAISVACEATIPVIVDGVTIYKKFSFAVANQGAGFGWNLVRNSNLSGGTKYIEAEGVTINVVDDSVYGKALAVTPVSGKRVYWNLEKVWVANTTYTVSFMAKASVAGQKIRPSRSIIDYGEEISLTTVYKQYTTRIVSTATVNGGTLSFSFSNASGDVTITNVKLEKGTEATEWTPHPDDLIGDTGKGIKSTAITYQASPSGTTIPTGTWSGSIPTVSAGQYLWTRTIFTYSDNATSTMYSVSHMGSNGANGSNGKSIGSVVNYYLATASSSGVTTSTSGWTTSAQSVSSSKKYLWNYEVVKYTDGTTASATAPCIIGSYGDTGSTGNGIKSITEHYAVSNSNSSVPTTWSTTVPTMTETNKYLWNYETITYTNNTTNDTTKRVIGAYGNKGETGSQGPAGQDANQVVHTVTGNGESNLYVEFAIVKVTGTYANQPTTFRLGGRGFETSDVQFNFVSENTTDPGLEFLRSSGGWSVWIYKKATSTWGLITKLSESLGEVRVFNYTKGSDLYTVTWTSSKMASLPSGAISAGSLQAARTATNFMDFTEGTGLEVGNKANGSWSGYRTRISSSAFEILNQAGTSLAYYGEKLIQLGKNTKDAVIELCGGKGKLAYINKYEKNWIQLSSDNILIDSTDEAYINGNGSTISILKSMITLRAYGDKNAGYIALKSNASGTGGASNDQEVLIRGCQKMRLELSDTLTQIDYGTDDYDPTNYNSYFAPSKEADGMICLGNAAKRRWHRVYAENATISTSDRRMKENIIPLGACDPMPMALDAENSSGYDIHSELFAKFQPVQYNFKKGGKDGKRTCYGLIAQDVLDSMKELGISEDELDLVHHDYYRDENGNPADAYGIAYENIIAMLIHEVQKLNTKVDNLESELNDKNSQDNTKSTVM